MILLATIVSLIAIGSVVLVGLLGHLIDKSGDPTEDKPEGAGNRP